MYDMTCVNEKTPDVTNLTLDLPLLEAVAHKGLCHWSVSVS